MIEFSCTSFQFTNFIFYMPISTLSNPTFLISQLNKNIPIKGFQFYVSTASWKMERPTVDLLRV